MFGKIRYITPGGQVYNLYNDMARQPHLLIAGATGSGKSVVENGIIYNLLHLGPSKAQLILIDPKKVELSQYKRVPHCAAYAAETSDIIRVLTAAVNHMEQRFRDMARCGLKMFDGPDLYVIIDELADLILTSKKQVLPLLQRIGQLGRAARVHIIACTQCPIIQVVPTVLKCNLDSRVALRTRSAQDSRNILGFSGCEKLPQYGQGYYMTPAGCTLYNIPMYTEDQQREIISYWTTKKCIA